MNSTAFWVNRPFSFQEAIQALRRRRVNSGVLIFSAVVSCQLNAAWLQNCSEHKWICGSGRVTEGELGQINTITVKF